MIHDRSSARRLLIRRLLHERTVCSQSELAALLGEAGCRVSQTTISRDLATLGATKRVDTQGHTHYALDTRPSNTTDRDRVRRVLGEYLQDIIPSANLVVLKVQAASAGTVAAAIDAAPPPGIIGTIAGDDTVLVIAEAADGGRAVVRAIQDILEV
jgi:transcriptional regulator of arginine metabolism